MAKSVRTGRSKNSRRSKLSNNSFHSGDEESSRHVGHPFERIYNKEVVQKMKKTNNHLIRLTFGDFKAIKFEPYLPAVINDLLEYLTAFSVEDFTR